jgi:hypothetical protein
MSLNQRSSLILNLEKRLGRELSSSERHLLLLAEEIFESEKPVTESENARSAAPGGE